MTFDPSISVGISKAGPSHEPCEFCGKTQHRICSSCDEAVCKGTCMCDCA
jgi:hypothetical protein